MAGTRSNGVSGGERRRKSRAGNGPTLATAPALADGMWLGRLDALADRLAGLDDRTTIIDQVASEAMQLLPADQVRVYADATAVTVPSFVEEIDGVPGRALIPLVIAGRHFGAVEIALKPQRALGPGERALSVALARQCALAIDSLTTREAQREARAALDSLAAAAAGVAPIVPTLAIAPAVAPVMSPVIAPVISPVLAGADLSLAQATLGRLESDLRALAKLARSAELPPAAWVDRAERTALRRLDELRGQLGGVKNAA
jgi:hypothetical protein